MPKYACRKDANHDAIAATYRKLGWDVIETFQVGQIIPGFPDLICSRHGLTLFVEVKSARGKLTDDEQDFYAEHEGDMRIIVDRSVDDVLERCGI